MFSFLVDSELDLFERLTGQIGAWPGLEIPLFFDIPSELRINAVDTQQLALG